MLNFDKHAAKIANLNTRAEKHGEDNEPAAYVKIEMHVTQTVLDSFDPVLRKFLFREPEKFDQLELQVDGESLWTALRCKNLKPLQWEQDFPGYRLLIGSELGLSPEVEIEGAELKRFVIDAIEGGSVKLSFTATCHPDEKTVGALYLMIQNDIVLTMIPPLAAEQVAHAEREQTAFDLTESLSQIGKEEHSKPGNSI